MKVIFLDFDGVIITSNTVKLAGRIKRKYVSRKNKRKRDTQLKNRLISKKSIRALNKVINDTGAVVVISSDWRYKPLKYLKRLLKRNRFCGKIIGRTPVWAEIDEPIQHPNYERGFQIKKWLEWNKNKVESYIIIDDDCDDIMYHFPNDYIQTGIERGFNHNYIEEAIKILENKNDRNKND